MRKDTPLKTMVVSLLVCMACSVFVSSAAVFLKPLQEANAVNDKKRNILIAAGLLDNSQAGDIAGLFEKIETKVVDLDTGEFVDDVAPEQIDYESALKDPGKSIALEAERDIAGIRRRPNLRLAYFLQNGDEIERIILPVQGKGLWSTLYGFIAFSPDANTVKSLAFYSHGETPGLGAEIDNPKWKSRWIDKKVFDGEGLPCIEVVKGTVDPQDEKASHQVDGISGATITGRGVSQLVRFWVGDQGYGPMLNRLKETYQPNGSAKGGE